MNARNMLENTREHNTAMCNGGCKGAEPPCEIRQQYRLFSFQKENTVGYNDPPTCGAGAGPGSGPRSVISRKMDSTCSELHVASGFLKKD